MIEYDPKVIYEYAGRVNSQIKSTVTCYLFIGLFAGIIIFGGISAMLAIGYDFLIMAIGALIGAIFGFSAGQNRAAEMRLQAQMSLCQVKIEENTRR